MKQKLKALASKLYTASPFIAGALVGYLGHGVIKEALSVALSAAKLFIKI